MRYPKDVEKKPDWFESKTIYDLGKVLLSRFANNKEVDNAVKTYDPERNGVPEGLNFLIRSMRLRFLSAKQLKLSAFKHRQTSYIDST